MNFVQRKGERVVIRQVPIALLLIGLIFSLPPLSFSLYHIFAGTDAEGKYFSLFFGLVMLWLFLEYVATRERIEIDLEAKTLTRHITGVFKHREQTIDLGQVTGIGLELKPDSRGRKFQYLYMYRDGEPFLLNTPAKRYLDQKKLGRLLSEVTLIPLITPLVAS